MSAKQIQSEFNVIVRIPSKDDNKTWAHGPCQKRVQWTEFLFELNDDKKVYIMRKSTSTHRQLVMVVDEPSDELLKFILEEDQYYSPLK